MLPVLGQPLAPGIQQIPGAFGGRHLAGFQPATRLRCRFARRAGGYRRGAPAPRPAPGRDRPRHSRYRARRSTSTMSDQRQSDQKPDHGAFPFEVRRSLAQFGAGSVAGAGLGDRVARVAARRRDGAAAGRIARVPAGAIGLIAAEGVLVAHRPVAIGAAGRIGGGAAVGIADLIGLACCGWRGRGRSGTARSRASVAASDASARNGARFSWRAT